jgi:RNA-binding protein
MIGSNGLTEPVLKEAERALNDHELIKIKIAGQDREQKKACAMMICESLEAELIQQIGNIIVIYRKNIDK